MRLIFEKSIPGRCGIKLPAADVPQAKGLCGKYLRQNSARLPEVSELDVVRHFTNLSKMNFSVDAHFYPLGSCTMKYNPKFTEKGDWQRTNHPHTTTGSATVLPHSETNHDCVIQGRKCRVRQSSA